MRVLAGFKYVAEHRFNTPYLVVVWNSRTNDLSGDFSEVFEPIPGVFFIPKTERPYYEKFALKHFRNHWIMYKNNLAWHQLKVDDFPKLEQESYTKLFRPVKAIREEVQKFISLHNICEMDGFHLRRTDLESDKELGRVMTKDEVFETAIEKSPGKVFITTDNPATRKKFMEKFGPNKIVFYGNMSESLFDGTVRYSNLFLTVIEAFIASRCRSFLGTVGSSWSEAISAFHRQCHSIDCCRKKII